LRFSRRRQLLEQPTLAGIRFGLGQQTIQPGRLFSSCQLSSADICSPMRA
jgi:hypothetical protein